MRRKEKASDPKVESQARGEKDEEMKRWTGRESNRWIVNTDERNKKAVCRFDATYIHKNDGDS